MAADLVAQLQATAVLLPSPLCLLRASCFLSLFAFLTPLSSFLFVLLIWLYR
jgi:hypothetical protein